MNVHIDQIALWKLRESVGQMHCVSWIRRDMPSRVVEKSTAITDHRGRERNGDLKLMSKCIGLFLGKVDRTMGKCSEKYYI